jgi:hypothetical protein
MKGQGDGQQPGKGTSQNKPPEIRVLPELQVTDNDGSKVADVDDADRSTILGSVSHFTVSDDEDGESMFRKFTPRSYRKLLKRAEEDKKKTEEKKNEIHEGRLVDGELKFDNTDDDEEKLERDPGLFEGGALPSYLSEDFPTELFRYPLEEIDPAIKDKVRALCKKHAPYRPQNMSFIIGIA